MKKTYYKSKDKCKVTFSYPANDDVRAVTVAGDFNGWSTEALPMKKGKSGFTTSVDLETGKDYQYRFFVDGERWEDDDTSDGFAEGPYCRNCVVSTR